MSKNSVKFTKMHGLGNDFLVINGLTQSVPIEKIPIALLANRHTGIGFDQLLLITSSSVADFGCRIFNADGSEAEHCGNGLRCVGRFIREEKLCAKETFSIELKKNQIMIETKDLESIKISMGIPQFAKDHAINIGNIKLNLSILSLGNPHAIVQVNSLAEIPVSKWGTVISTDAHFPQGVNVGFMQVVSPDHILLKTFERGSGETLACGSNASAAAVVGMKQNQLHSKVKVELPLGTLSIEWQGDGTPIYMSGPATRVFEGSF